MTESTNKHYNIENYEILYEFAFTFKVIKKRVRQPLWLVDLFEPANQRSEHALVSY